MLQQIVEPLARIVHQREECKLIHDARVQRGGLEEDGELPVRDVLEVAQSLGHAREHLAQIELTKQLFDSRS